MNVMMYFSKHIMSIDNNIINILINNTYLNNKIIIIVNIKQTIDIPHPMYVTMESAFVSTAEI